MQEAGNQHDDSSTSTTYSARLNLTWSDSWLVGSSVWGFSQQIVRFSRLWNENVWLSCLTESFYTTSFSNFEVFQNNCLPRTVPAFLFKTLTSTHYTGRLFLFVSSPCSASSTEPIQSFKIQHKIKLQELSIFHPLLSQWRKNYFLKTHKKRVPFL